MKIFVTGGTGLLGGNVIKVALEKYDAEVSATVHRHPPDSAASIDWVPADLGDQDLIERRLRSVKPDAVIHTAILNDPLRLHRQWEYAWALYVEATRALAETATEIGAKFVFVSTDWVFDGTQAPADEPTPPRPINDYGTLKLVGETLVDALCDDGAVARVAGLYGRHWLQPDAQASQNAGFGDLVTAVVEALSRDEPFTVWNDVHINHCATPTWATDAAERILELATSDAKGTFHCCGGTGVTRLELARATADAFGLDAALLQEGSSPLDNEALTGAVPSDTRLQAARSSRALGRPLRELSEALEGFRREREATNPLIAT